MDHVGGDDGNDGVPEPVGGGGQTDTTGADGQRENLADDDPGTGTPGGGEPKDEDGNEGDLGIDGGGVVSQALLGIAGIRVGVVEANGHTNDGDEELADKHSTGTDDEDSATTEALDSPEGERSGADVDKSENERDEETVLNGTGGLEERGGVVEDEVDAGPLLHHLERGTQDGSAQVRAGLAETALEAVGPATEPGGVGDESTLVFLVGDNLGQFTLDVDGVLGLATDTSKSVHGSGDVALLDEVTGRVGEEEQTAAENQSPGELDGDGDAVGAGVGAALCGVDDNGGKHDTNGDAELVSSDERTTDLARAL